jgi:hypothetical protein
MTIEKKKNLLIPLNNPRPPALWVRIVIAILRPPLLVLGFVFGNLYKLCFGWLDKRMARQNEQRFAEDIRTHLAFLFSEHGAHFIPNANAFPSLRSSKDVATVASVQLATNALPQLSSRMVAVPREANPVAAGFGRFPMTLTPMLTPFDEYSAGQRACTPFTDPSR